MTDHTPIEIDSDLGRPAPGSSEPSVEPMVDLSGGRSRRNVGHQPTMASDNVVLLLPDTSAPEPLDAPLVVRLREALDATTEIILVIEPGGRILYANRPARSVLGLADVDPTFRSLGRLLDGSTHDVVWDSLDTTNEWRGDLSTTRADGSALQLELTVLADRSATGDVRSLTVIGHDVGEHRALQTALEHRTTHDGLTGLANRQHLLHKIGEQLPLLHDRGQSAALLLLDIDEFRTVTNSLGHEAGDRVLVAFAYRLLRTFTPNAVLARVGGDEFGVFCPGLADVDELAESVLRATSAPFYIDGTEVQLSVVTGIAVSTPDDPAVDGETLLRAADAACYRAKESGHGSFEVYEPHLQARAADRLSVVADLRRAIRNDELRVLYQPKISLDSGTIIGAEALLRWQLPGGEMRPPAAFMDIAEDTGLIIPMGVFVMREACAAAVELRKATGVDIEVSINLSVRQLDHPSLPGDLEDALRDSGVDPAMIELEITESALMSDVDASAAVLNQLKGLGTRVAVDDFGTGYSSLQYLQSLPVDVLKVDRTFVSGLGESHGSTVITSAVIRLSSALGLVSVAEGVETPDQLARLRALGCSQAQGYHIARPMSIADLIDLIKGDPTW